ncbi:MAG: hypothetical protein AAGF12_14535 [Myxococcota bacterium]
MTSVLALVSKGVFEKDFGSKVMVGDVLPFEAYHSKQKTLQAMADGGDLYLVTVRPDDVLWLVGVLRKPRFADTRWEADRNVVPVTAASSILGRLEFSTGKGVKADPGKLGMSLQTPRKLTEGDVAQFEGLIGGSSPGSTHPTSTQEKATAGQSATKKAAKKPPTKKPITKKPATRNSATKKSHAGKPTRVQPPVDSQQLTPEPPRPDGVPQEAWYDLQRDRFVHGAFDSDGLRTGLWRQWRLDGSLKYEKEMRHGLVHGASRGYHPDGSLAFNTTVDNGVQSTTQHYAWTAPSDVPGFEKVVPGIASWSWISRSPHRYHVLQLVDADGHAVDGTGERLPERPASVHEDAMLLPADEGKIWQHVAYEQGTMNPVGFCRQWTLGGEFLQDILWDDQGKERWRRQSTKEDPRRAAIDAFQQATEFEFQPTYDLINIWDPELHTELLEWLPQAADAAVAAYIEGLGERGWLFKYHTPEGAISFKELQLEVIDRWRKTRRSKESSEATDAIDKQELELRCELHDRARVKELYAHLTRKGSTLHRTVQDDLRELVEPLVSGTLDTRLDELKANQGEGASDDEVLALARRQLKVLGLSIELHHRKLREALLVDPKKRAYIYSNGHVESADIEVDESRWCFARHLRDVEWMDERRLYWSGKNVWWVLYRFGTSLMLQGSAFFPDRDQGEVTLDLFVRCPNWQWTERIMRLFEGTKPRTARLVDPHFHQKEGWAWAYAYESQGQEDPKLGRVFSRLVHDNTLWSGSGSPGVMRLYMLEKAKDRGPRALQKYDHPSQAAAALVRIELPALVQGYSLQRVVNLPVVMQSEDKKPTPKLERAPADVGDVGESVLNELQAAAKHADAGDLGAAVAGLRSAWERRPAPAIANALDGFDKVSPPLHEASGRGKASHTHWNNAEKGRDAIHLPGLLTSLMDAPAKEVASRLDRLMEWPLDPRLDRVLAKLAWDVPLTSSGSQVMWRRVFKRLGSSRDGRVLDTIQKLEERYKKVWDTQAGEWAVEQVQKILAARSATLGSLAALGLSEKEQSVLASLQPEAPAAEADPLAPVFDDPHDDAKRIALADAIDGPRAELIRLQAQEKRSADKTKRLKALLKEHSAGFAGPLASVLLKNMKFRLGFLSEATVRTDTAIPGSLLASPYWHTIESLDVNSRLDILGAAPLPSLRRVRGVLASRDMKSADEWLGFLPRMDPPLERLESLQASLKEWDNLVALFDTMEEDLPALRSLDVTIRSAPPESPRLHPIVDELDTLVFGLRGRAGGLRTDSRGMQIAAPFPKEIGFFAAAFALGRDVELGLDLQISQTEPPLRFRLRKEGHVHHLTVRSQLWPTWVDQVVAQTCGLLEALDPKRCPTAAVQGKLSEAKKAKEQIERVGAKVGIEVDVSKIKAG